MILNLISKIRLAGLSEGTVPTKKQIEELTKEGASLYHLYLVTGVKVHKLEKILNEEYNEADNETGRI